MGRKLKMEPADLIGYIKQWAGKRTAFEMHKDTGIHIVTIRDYARQAGVSLMMQDLYDRKEFIYNTVRDNHLTQTAGDISRNFDIPVSAVWSAARTLKLPIKRECEGANVQAIADGRFFNEMERENWLV